MIRSGQAHSPRLADSHGQVQFDFEGDNTSDLLPRCEMNKPTERYPRRRVTVAKTREGDGGGGMGRPPNTQKRKNFAFMAGLHRAG